MKQFGQKISYAIILLSAVAFLGYDEIKAQNPTPTPTPTPKLVDRNDNLKSVDDVQKVKPENLKGVPTIAPTYRSEDKSLPELGRVGVDMLSQKPLALREAIVKALENNKDIEVSRKDVKIAEFDLQASYGFFTPIIIGRTLFERAPTPNVSIFNNNPTTTDDSTTAELGYQGFIKDYGTTYTANFKTGKLTTDNPLSILSPQFDSSFEFKLTQPLFRGRKSDDPRRGIEIAKRNLSLTDKQFRQKALEITVLVQRAYWDLTFTLRNLQVQRDGVKDAKEQLEHNKRLVKEGMLAPVDVLAAQTQVANLEQNVYLALDGVNRAENNLKNLIAENRNDSIWSKSLIPTDAVELNKPRTSLAEAIQIALENRIEIDILNVSKEINDYDKRFYKEQLEPEIDLTFSYKSNGISGRANSDVASFFSNTTTTQKINEIISRINSIEPNSLPINQLPIAPVQTVPSSLTGGYFSSATDIFSNRYPTFSIGINFRIAHDDKAQKALLGKSLVQGERIKLLREQIEQAIQVDVRNALQAIKTSESRLRLAAISRENSEKQYDSEKRKLDAGLSDIYRVLDRQTALVNARSIELQAQIELNKSIAELERATGNSLKANNVETRLRK